MSISRLSAGAGYRYLLKNIAVGDRELGPRLQLVPGQDPLVAYYAATGNPPGRWLGRALPALGGGGLRPGEIVTEKAMAALYGKGHDPVTGEQLGRPYPTFKSAAIRIADAVAGLPAELSEEARAAAVAGIEKHVQANPTRSAVAGYDLTFTVPKSVSVLWALGDETVQTEVIAAHRAAIDGVLDLIEDRFLHTRIGAQSCAQVPAQGLIAAAFDHFDSRAHDPHLHTHVVVANKVQGPDGLWRSVDGQELYGAAVALSEVYNDLFADQLSQRLPVTWSWRERGPRSSPVFEIDGIDDELLAVFSQRSAAISAQVEDLVADLTARQGREPSRAEVLRLRQRATLTTRPEKDIRSLAELREGWRATATAATGKHPDELVGQALASIQKQWPATAPISPEAQAAGLAAELADAVLAGVAVRRPTWTRANLLAEAARATRHLRLTDPAERIALLDQVVDRVLTSCVALDPPELFHTPQKFRRIDGTSMFDRPSEAAFTTTAVLDAEARLLAALADLTAPAVPTGVLAGLDRPMPGQRLSPDQHAAINGIATSTRRLDVLIGPAGTGKTKTLAILTRAWAHAYGPGSVLGLAPSSSAAAELAASLQIPCENTAKWLHDHDREIAGTTPATETAGNRPAPVARMLAHPLQPGMLVIVDEASLASTAHLDRLLAHATAAGAKLLLVGDNQQLGAVEAGGAFALLADTGTAAGTAHALEALWRFENRWEAHATRNLRVGDPVALVAYAEHGRLHDGDTETMAEAAYRAWRSDLDAGRSSLLIAPDHNTVTALNLRARDDRLAAGEVAGPEVALRDGTTCAVGDWIITRQNDRRLPVPGGGHVRNGAAWTVTAVHPDGTLEATPRDQAESPARNPDRSRTRSPQPAGSAVQLPARYVADHVELGYASTIHRAQGATVETAHVLARPGMDRQSLYVAMTRGRQANHAYVPLDGFTEEHQASQWSGRQVLEQVVATDGTEFSATATMRQRQDAAGSRRRLEPIRETLRAAQLPDAAAELTRLIALAGQRNARLSPAHKPPGATPRPPEPGPIRR
jgi:conjugative relaxase-like TrwC/TraI family protein